MNNIFITKIEEHSFRSESRGYVGHLAQKFSTNYLLYDQIKSSHNNSIFFSHHHFFFKSKELGHLVAFIKILKVQIIKALCFFILMFCSVVCHVCKNFLWQCYCDQSVEDYPLSYGGHSHNYFLIGTAQVVGP